MPLIFKAQKCQICNEIFSYLQANLAWLAAVAKGGLVISRCYY